MTDKTYEDGVRDGFEACRKVAEAVCRENAGGWRRTVMVCCEDDPDLARKAHAKTISLETAADQIAALTPESPND